MILDNWYKQGCKIVVPIGKYKYQTTLAEMKQNIKKVNESENEILNAKLMAIRVLSDIFGGIENARKKIVEIGPEGSSQLFKEILGVYAIVKQIFINPDNIHFYEISKEMNPILLNTDVTDENQKYALNNIPHDNFVILADNYQAEELEIPNGYTLEFIFKEEGAPYYNCSGLINNILYINPSCILLSEQVKYLEKPLNEIDMKDAPFLINTILYLTTNPKFVERIFPKYTTLEGKKTTKRDRKAIINQAKNAQYYKINIPHEIRQNMEKPNIEGLHWTLDKRVLVRGHWRNQSIGSKAKRDHKYIFIAPYWKGPDGAPISRKYYSLQSKS